MNAKELRLGNWITAGRVERIYPDGCMIQLTDTAPSDELMTMVIEPIPLTEEALLKCGFFQNNGVASREFLLINGEHVIKMVNHYEDGWLFIPNWWKVGKMIKSIHQLQNLFFCLSGEELTYTP